jgi:hypothetical protein
LGAHIAQIGWQTATAGIEAMDSTLKPLKATLEAIRDMASNALDQIERPQETRSMRWECKEMPVHETFYSAGSIGSGWQMPPMQKYGV